MSLQPHIYDIVCCQANGSDLRQKDPSESTNLRDWATQQVW